MAKKSNKSESASATPTAPAAPADATTPPPVTLERGTLQMLGLVKDQLGQLEDAVNLLRDQLNGFGNELSRLRAEEQDSMSAPRPSNPPSAPSPSNPIRTPRPRPVIRLCSEPATVAKEIDDSIGVIRQGMTDLQVSIEELSAKARKTV